MIHHIVALQARPESGRVLAAALADFARNIVYLDGVIEATWGENQNEASGSLGYSHVLQVLLTEFSTVESYLAYPAHAILSAIIDRTCFGRLVFDFET